MNKENKVLCHFAFWNIVFNV